MALSVKEIEPELMVLPPVERAMLAEKLLSSFDGSEQGPLDAVWAGEAESRIAAFEAGHLPSSEANDVHSRIEKKYFS
jgi:putative addiction module component (TIGR02574 family)